MGREILQKPSVLVVSQPTWGVDAGAAAAIHQALVDLAAAVLPSLSSARILDELRALCDTLAVINMVIFRRLVRGEISVKRSAS